MKYCSILICHYAQTDDFGTDGADRSKILRECVDSLSKCVDYPAEVLVWDNGGNKDDTDWLVEQVRIGTINTLIRSKDNLKFAYAWNALARLATGDYLCFTCNDIRFKKGWLSESIKLLEKYSDRKLIASPFITPDKNRDNFNKEILPDARINSMAGSNCMIMSYQTWRDIGEFPHHRVGGSLWHRMMVRKGYLVIVPPIDLVEHIAFRQGVNWHFKAPCEKILLNGEKVDFHYYDYEHHLYAGKQKLAGAPLL